MQSAPRVNPTPLMPADRCTGDPKFLERIGLSRRAIIDTTGTRGVGVIVFDVDERGQPTRSVVHPSWSQAGHVGRIQRDRHGHIYLHPAPNVSLEHNPIERANRIYRIDSESGVMSLFVELPKAAEANERNPFGVLALALDCDADALYASTVYGSTPSAERGVIARIDLGTRTVRVARTGLDALSLAVAREGPGRRLYVGTARDNTIISYAIKPDGTLADDERVEIELDRIPVAQDKRPRVLRIDAEGRLHVRSIPFDYTLAARTSIPTAELVFARTASGAFELIHQRESQVPAGGRVPRPAESR
ncbi:MAG: hypothetical protein NZ533_11205 [Casimicrobiaceae bacterium]|nr:hypothetical protein [Casimicrobiaceae bacterium]